MWSDRDLCHKIADRIALLAADGSDKQFGLFERTMRRRSLSSGILAVLAEEGWIAETGHVGSSYIKAHRSAGGAKGRREPMPLASRVAAGQRISTPLSLSSDDHSVSS